MAKTSNNKLQHLSKTYFSLNIRLRQDSGASEPEYTENDVIVKLTEESAFFHMTENGTIMILDRDRTNKIMAVVEL